MLAAYTTRRLPSASRRPSCTESFWLAGQRNVPSGWRAKSAKTKRPHRHFRLSSLIEIAGVEDGAAEEGEKKEAGEEQEHAIRNENCPRSRWFMVPPRLYPTGRQRFSRTCQCAGQAPEKAGA